MDTLISKNLMHIKKWRSCQANCWKPERSLSKLQEGIKQKKTKQNKRKQTKDSKQQRASQLPRNSWGFKLCFHLPSRQRKPQNSRSVHGLLVIKGKEDSALVTVYPHGSAPKVSFHFLPKTDPGYSMCGPWASITQSCSHTQTLRPTPDVLDQNLCFNTISRQRTCMWQSQKPWKKLSCVSHHFTLHGLMLTF